MKENIILDDHLKYILSEYKWYSGCGRTRKYFAAVINGKRTLLHRHIFFIANGSIPPGTEIDHIDKNPFNNKITNLRAITRSENHINSKLQKNNKSGYRGVKWYKPYSKWMVSVKKMGKNHFFGYFKNKQDAVRAAKNAYKILFPKIKVY